MNYEVSFLVKFLEKRIALLQIAWKSYGMTSFTGTLKESWQEVQPHDNFTCVNHAEKLHYLSHSKQSSKLITQKDPSKKHDR
jgi:hypothetical protein